MPKEQTKIAVIGEAGSGKDYVADLMIDYFGFKRYAFADEVKRIATEYFPDQYGDGTSKNRQLLIDIGMGFRSIESDVWVDFLQRKIENGGGNRIIVTDTRMPNEYARLKSMGFRFVRIVASPSVRAARIEARGDVVQPNVLNHETEMYFDQFVCDYVIENETDEKIMAYAAVANLLEDRFGFK